MEWGEMNRGVKRRREHIFHGRGGLHTYMSERCVIFSIRYMVVAHCLHRTKALSCLQEHVLVVSPVIFTNMLGDFKMVET